MKCKRKYKILSFFISLIFMLGTLSACTTSHKTNTKETVSPDKSDLIICTDGLGRKITLDKPAEKIIVYSPCVNFLCALDSEDKFLEIGNKNTIETKLISQLVPNADDLYAEIDINNSVNVEHLISLNPDLIILPGMLQGDLDILEKANLNVFVVVGENIEQIKDTMDNLSIALGKEDIGADFTQYYDEILKLINVRVSDIPYEDKPKIYFTGTNFLTTCTKNMFQNYLIEYSGGINLSSEIDGSSWTQVSPEQILAWNPDIIFIPSYGKTEITPEEIINDPKWKDLNAVKNKRVYFFPSNLIPWDYPSVQTILGMLWTAKIIYPDKFQDIDVEQQSNEFFEKYFNDSFSNLGGAISRN
ncbi:MAG: ABC transporter substrate-binding protein [Clostridiaceae bacterium]